MIRIQGPNGETMDTTEKAFVKVAFTKNGSPAPVDPNEPVRWDVIQGNVTMEVATTHPDGSPLAPNEAAAWFISGDTAETSRVKMLADSMLGDGVTELSEEFEVPVGDAQANNVSATVFGFVPKL